MIVVNKWDLIEKDNNTMKEWTEFLKKKLAPFNDIQIIFTSVLSKQRIFDVLQTAIRVYQSRKRRISTSELNDFLLPLIENYPPPATKGKYIKIKYVTQLPTPTPQFAFFVNLPQYIKEPYRRFLENNIRPLGFRRGADADLFPAEVRRPQYKATGPLSHDEIRKRYSRQVPL